ncbi:MAG: cytochrome-c peroxidase [Myxococcales bacterium]|nr:cytochrome-c peroxidase [Myxococcales bacterium]
MPSSTPLADLCRLTCAALLLAAPLACGEATEALTDAGVTPEVDAGAETPDAGVEPTVELVLPDTPYHYEDELLPAHFRVDTFQAHSRAVYLDDNTPDDNPITNAGATLGRVLFYDQNLSQNRTISCGSCHKQAFGFSDDRVLSVGFEGGNTRRHSMGLTNARFYAPGRFFWDQRAATLEDQVLMPMQDPVEMGMTLDQVVARVEEAEYYPALFEAAFGDAAVTTDRISKALAQFVRSILSTKSKYDVGRAMVGDRFEDFPNFTQEENLGKKMVVAPPPMGGLGCLLCHTGEAFIAVQAMNNGLDLETTDPGYGEVTGAALDDATFKVPSLRNVAVRAPYMHDGRFATLEEVVEHYSTGIQAHPNLPLTGFFPRTADGSVQPLNLSVYRKSCLVAFLKTLTDEELLTDPRFSDPFVRQ